MSTSLLASLAVAGALLTCGITATPALQAADPAQSSTQRPLAKVHGYVVGREGSIVLVRITVGNVWTEKNPVMRIDVGTMRIWSWLTFSYVGPAAIQAGNKIAFGYDAKGKPYALVNRGRPTSFPSTR